MRPNVITEGVEVQTEIEEIKNYKGWSHPVCSGQEEKYHLRSLRLEVMVTDKSRMVWLKAGESFQEKHSSVVPIAAEKLSEMKIKKLVLYLPGP